MKNGLLIFSPCLLHHFLPVHWDQAKELVCRTLGSRPTQAQELFTLVSLWNNLPLSVLSAISVATFQKPLKAHLFDLTFTPAHLSAHWFYRTVSSILILNTDSAVAPASLASSGVLVLWKFHWLINWWMFLCDTRDVSKRMPTKTMNIYHNGGVYVYYVPCQRATLWLSTST